MNLLNRLTELSEKQMRGAEDDVTALTNFLRQHLQVGHPIILEELDAIHTVEAIVLDHVEGCVYSQALQDGAFPLGDVSFLPPGVLNSAAQQVVRVGAHS